MNSTFATLLFNNLTFCPFFCSFCVSLVPTNWERVRLLYYKKTFFRLSEIFLKVFRIEMPGNQVPRNIEEENETNFSIKMLRSAWGEINCRRYVHWSIWECWLRFDNIFNCSEERILSLSFTNWLIFSKQIIMQLGLARNYKPSALKTSVNEVFQKLIFSCHFLLQKELSMYVDPWTEQEPSVATPLRELARNIHYHQKVDVQLEFKKKGIGKAGVAKFRF